MSEYYLLNNESQKVSKMVLKGPQRSNISVIDRIVKRGGYKLVGIQGELDIEGVN